MIIGNGLKKIENKAQMISIARPVLEEVVATRSRLGAVEGPVATI